MSVDDSVYSDTPETAPPIPKGRTQIKSAELRKIRSSHKYQTLREQFRFHEEHRWVDGQEGAPCWLCFGPKTLIRTHTGYTAIEDVRRGDRVLSTDGTWQTVTQLFQHQFIGNAISLRTSSMVTPVLVTPEHPVLALRADHNHSTKIFTDENGPFCSPGLCQPRTWLETWIGGARKQRRVLNVDGNLRGKSHQIEWAAVGELRGKSWIATACPTADVDLEEIAIPFIKNRKGPVEFDLTDEFLWAIGLYLAEGSCSARHITFTLHEDETDYQQRVIDLFSALGYTASLMPTGALGSKGVRIHVSSTNLALWFSSWLGVGCQNKRIPEELMRLPVKKAMHVVRGVFDGDGSQDGSAEILGQTSKILALQVVEILARSGIMATTSLEASPLPAPSGNPRKPVYSVRWPALSPDGWAQSGRWSFLGESLSQVREHKEVWYEGPVYNLSVTGNNTYVVQNISVHNCGRSIDFRLQYPHPYSWSLDHAVTVKEAPQLIMDPNNFRSSCLDCNTERGTDDPKLDLGIPSECW